MLWETRLAGRGSGTNLAGMPQFLLASTFATLALLVFLGTLVAVSVVDLHEQRIPDRILLPGCAAVFALLVAHAIAAGDASRLANGLVAATWGLAGSLLLHLIGRTSFGFGDVKLAGLIGLMAGWLSPAAAMVAVVAAFGGAGAVVVVLMLLRRAGWSTRFAFGPFMALAAIATTAGAVIGAQ